MIVQDGMVLATAGSSESSEYAESTHTTSPVRTPGHASAVWTDTQTRPFPTAIACGLPPTSIVFTTLLRTGSIRDTVPSRLFATQTLPKPTAMPVGERPTGIVVVTEFVAGSIRTTAPASRSATQTAPAPTATASAPSPTVIDSITCFVTGSIRATLLPSRVTDPHCACADRDAGGAVVRVDARCDRLPSGIETLERTRLGRYPDRVRAGGDARCGPRLAA